MKSNERLLLFAVVVVLFAGSLLAIYEFSLQGKTASGSTSVGSSTVSVIGANDTAATWSITGYVTGTSAASEGDTFFTPNFPCFPTIGGFELRIVSDSSGAPVSGEKLNAIGRLGVDCNGQAETQVVHIKTFSVGQEGWLMPIFPSQAIAGGNLDFTASYQSKTYTFSGGFPPIGTNCVTLHVPSGNVTRATAMNGIGSYCFQG